jgi:outer membrane murein-binding lipoprotein Lpp
MKITIVILTALFIHPAIGSAQESSVAAEVRELRSKLERLEKKMAEEEAQKAKRPEAEKAALTEQVKKDVIADVASKGQGFFGKLIEQTKVGAYGSMRYGTSSLDDLHNSFTFRRFVLTVDSPIAERLRANMELEFERFTELEIERRTFPTAGGLQVQQAIEGTNKSEISLEQAWLQYDIADWLKFRGGAVLVPLGRFNINHDDNRWDLPRRSLVDRGVPVLPSTAAWPEIGAGFLGDFSIGNQGKINYQFYVMNGVSLDSELEQVSQTRAGDTTKLVQEVEVRPTRGTFSDDLKTGKAIATRWAYSPWLGDEIAASFYWGRYTPDFLADKPVFSFALDGKKTWGPFEIEGQYVNTHWSGVNSVARSFARRALVKESEGEVDDVETEVEFELANLATRKQGYWVDLRYRFWPEFLSNTLLGRHFANPQLVSVLRWEQVWFSGLIKEMGFTGGTLTDLSKESRLLNRLTLGLAYRPVPSVAFQLAYEYTRTNQGKSLSSVTNFLTSGKDREFFQHALLFGLTFGF